MMRTIAAFAAAVAVIAGPAIAGETAPLTTETATRFVATLDGVQALGKEFDAEGKLVTNDSLADALWDTAPARVERCLQVHVATLRKKASNISSVQSGAL